MRDFIETVGEILVAALVAAALATLFATCSGRARGAESFVVVNKTAPTFTVVNKTTAPPAVAHRIVTTDGRTLERQPDGTYREVAAAATRAAPGVAAPTFRGTHAGHNCPACGRSQFVVAGFNGDGTHTHVCPGCSTSWRH